LINSAHRVALAGLAADRRGSAARSGPLWFSLFGDRSAGLRRRGDQPRRPADAGQGVGLVNFIVPTQPRRHLTARLQ
jgi:hypothetical protein